MASDPSRRGSNFCRFLGLRRRKNNDILGIYFVRNCVFSDAPEPVQNKIPKKVTFLGNFSDVFLIMFPFPGYIFTLCFLGGPRRPVGRPKKRHFFGAKNCHFFGAKNCHFFGAKSCHFFDGLFWVPCSCCGARILYLSANRLEPRIRSFNFEIGIRKMIGIKYY